MARHQRILVGAVSGAVLGLIAKTLAGDTAGLTWVIDTLAYPTGQIFLRLLFMLVIPLLFSALSLGVAELDLRELGRVGVRMLGYTVVVSAIAVVIGLVLVNVLQPGAGFDPAAIAAITHGAKPPAPVAETSPITLIINLFPDNPIKAAATGDMLGVIVFSLFFGVGLSLTKTEGAIKLREMLQGLYDVMLRLVDVALSFAPIGVGALMFTLTARLGLGILGQLAAYVGVVLLALGIHMFVVYSLSVKLFGGMSPIVFFRAIRTAMLTAFSTASSSATLPTALHVAEHELKLPPRVARFVLTAGSAMNQNGTALFEGVTVLFLAQVFNVHLAFTQQISVMLICILGGIGTAGVPAGSLPVIAMILASLGIPVEGLGLILGVDRLLDMCRTTLNVAGDLAAAVYVAKATEAEA